MAQNTAGGAAAAGGIDYQARCAAWFATRILADGAAPVIQALWTGRLERLACETGEPIDDISVIPATGPPIAVQCKRKLSLETTPTSDFGETVDQFVNQHLSPGHEVTRLVIATTSESSAPVRNTLRVVLDRIRTLAQTDDVATAATNAAEEDVLRRTTAHVTRAWNDNNGLNPTEAEIRRILCCCHVLVIDLDSGQPSELEALSTLNVVVADSTQIPSAWALLVEHCHSLAKSRTGIDRQGLQQLLATNHISLIGLVDLQGGVAKLKEATGRELDRLDSGFVTITTPTDEIAIRRTVTAQVEEAAAAGPVLITGDPGTGKTVTLHHLARSLLTAGEEIVFLAVGNIRAASLGELSNELGLDHPLYDVLAEFSPGTPKTLIIDALDAARGDGQPDLWRQVIAHVTTNLADWRVVATVRSWDLRNSRHLTRQFPSPPIKIDDLDDDELAAAVAGWTELEALVANAHAGLRSLIRNPYNLRLVADLLLAGVPLGDLEGLNDQIQLLDSYWEDRVTSGAGGAPRQAVTHALSRSALEQHTMTIDTAAVTTGDTGASTPLGELLSQAVLVDATVATVPGLPAVVRYSHHVLHDFALSLELLGAGGLLGELRRDPNLVITAAPSVEFHLQRLWDSNPETFWATVIELHNDGVAPLAVVHAADVAARNLSDVRQLAALTNPLDSSTATISHITLLRYLALAFVLDHRTEPAIEPEPWAQLALALCNHLDQTELIVRILVGELVAFEPPIAGVALQATGAAARADLEHRWAGPPDGVNRLAIEYVIRSSSSDPSAAEELLRRAIEPDRLVSHGASDLWGITNQVATLVEHVPAFVTDLYVAVMGYDEQSREPTRLLGGQILPLSSNRHQDVQGAKYNLVEDFDGVLRAAPEIAVAVLRQVVPPRSPKALDHTCTVGDRNLTIVLDGSELLDDWDYATGSDPLTMLDKFESLLADSAEPSTWLDLLAGGRTPVVIWRRVASAATRNPDLAAALGTLDATSVSPPTSELRELFGDQVHLPQPVRNDGFGSGGTMAYDPWHGIDVTNSTDKRVAELVELIAPFVHAHFNELPSVEQLAANDSPVRELELIVDAGYDGTLADQAADTLAQVAAIWARLPSEVAGDRHHRARARLLTAMTAAEPEPLPGHYGGVEVAFGHGPRTYAARGLTTLGQFPEHADEELLAAITTLSKDPVAWIRCEVLSRLSYLQTTAPETIWEILEERAAHESTEPVLRTVTFKAGDQRADPDRAAAIVDTVANKATDARTRSSSAGACADVSASMWVFLGNNAAQRTTTRLLDLDVLDADAISSVLHGLRTSGSFVAENGQVRTRALGLCEALIAQGRARFARLEVDPAPSDDERLAIREGAKLLDTVARQLYFAAGVQAARQDPELVPRREELRLVDEASQLLDQLAEVPVASVAHHLVEIQAFVLDVRPTKALAAIAKVVTGGGRIGGYAFEALAVSALVGIVARLLADHRSIFDDPENLTSMRAVLEVFIEAGSPDAHEIVYGLGQIIR